MELREVPGTFRGPNANESPKKGDWPQLLKNGA